MLMMPCSSFSYSNTRGVTGGVAGYGVMADDVTPTMRLDGGFRCGAVGRTWQGARMAARASSGGVAGYDAMADGVTPAMHSNDGFRCGTVGRTRQGVWTATRASSGAVDGPTTTFMVASSEWLGERACEWRGRSGLDRFYRGERAPRGRKRNGRQ
jgi:hypothetical protein